MNNQKGQAVLELILVFPLVLLLILSLLQVTELIVAQMGVTWAARQAARAASVHLENGADVASKVALRSLGPFLPSIPGIESAIKVKQLPAYERLTASVSEILGEIGTITKSIDETGLMVGRDLGTGRAASKQQKRIESTLETEAEIPALLGDWYRELPLKFRWMARAQGYEHLGNFLDDDSSDTVEILDKQLGFSPHPVTTTVTWYRFEQKHWRALATSDEVKLEKKKAYMVEVEVIVRSPMRIPIVGRLFAHNRWGLPYRYLKADARFPIITAPSPKK